MKSQHNGSKRQSLRFSALDHAVRYKTEFEDGGALIENVSTGGCAMSSLEVPLSLKEKLLLLLDLDENTIEIGARVIRVEENRVAVQFTDIAEENSLKLVKYFASKQRTAKRV